MPTSATAELPISFLRKLGEGSFGEVHLGVVRPHGEVAIKVIGRPSSCPPSDWLVERDTILREADALAELRHPNVVGIYGCGHDPSTDRAFIYTEFCPGGTLAAKIEQGPMSLAEFRPVLLDVLQGLEALHGKNKIHRDLKPGNILLDSKGRARLADFGLVTNLMYFGYAARAGYIAHLAPEVYAHNFTSPKTDIWALGMTIYRVVNGEPWWLEFLKQQKVPVLPDGPNPDAIKDLVRAGGWSKRLTWMPHVPDAWQRLVRKALHDDTNQRFANATAMLTTANTLPPGSNWTSLHGSDQIVWSRPTNANRRAVVEWERQSGRQHVVRARTEPVSPSSSGRVMRQHDSGTVGRAEALRQLEGLLLKGT